MKTVTLTDEEYVVLQKILMETSAADLPLTPKERQCQRRILRKCNAVKLPTVDIDAFPLTNKQLVAGLDEYIESYCSQIPQEKPGSREEFERLLDEALASQQKPYKPIEQSWNEFLLHYYPFKLEDLVDVTGTKLTPSYHGKECLGNGEFVGYECCCDNCDYYLLCFPCWEEHTEKPVVKSTCPATHAARAYLVGKDLAIQPTTPGYLNGFQQVSTTQVTVRVNGSMKSIWNFDVLQVGETTGYRIRSYLDALDIQCTYRHWQTAYHLLMDGIAAEENTTAEITKDESF